MIEFSLKIHNIISNRDGHPENRAKFANACHFGIIIFNYFVTIMGH